MATASDVAAWMANELEKYGWIRHREIVRGILAQFGDEFLYTNANGNKAICKPVLQEFKEVTKGSAKWDRRHLCWSRPKAETEEQE